MEKQRTILYPDDPIKQRIFELKMNLEQTDYQPLKYIDGEYTEEEYAVLKAQRQAWREEIRQLEGKHNAV